MLAICSVAIFFVVLVGAAGITPTEKAVTDLKKALAKADFDVPRSGGFPRFGVNPYAPVLRIVRQYGHRLPAIWRARALGHYADFLCLPWRFSSYPNKSVAAAYQKKGEAILIRAVGIAPGYTNGWISLALVSMSRQNKINNAAFRRYLLRAYDTDPLNPYVQGLRAWDVCRKHGGHGVSSGTFTGNVGFNSSKWRRVFCYRALMFLRYRQTKTLPRVFGNLTNLWTVFFRETVNFYAPKELAQLDAGKWEPGPCPDPWPPVMRNPSQATSKEK
jgi:hypothetical protein